MLHKFNLLWPHTGGSRIPAQLPQPMLVGSPALALALQTQLLHVACSQQGGASHQNGQPGAHHAKHAGKKEEVAMLALFLHNWIPKVWNNRAVSSAADAPKGGEPGWNEGANVLEQMEARKGVQC